MYENTHLWFVLQQGRGGGFPGRRRPRGGGSGRGRGRSRLKAMASCIDAFLVSFCNVYYTLHCFKINAKTLRY